MTVRLVLVLGGETSGKKIERNELVCCVTNGMVVSYQLHGGSGNMNLWSTSFAAHFLGAEFIGVGSVWQLIYGAELS